MVTMNIIGAGQVGQTLGSLLVMHQTVTIVGIVNTHIDSATLATQRIRQGTAYPSIDALPHANLTLIATPDDSIEEVAAHLAHNPHLAAGDVVCHCSGALSSDVLARLSPLGVGLASIHPMMSFKDVSLSRDAYQDVPCAVEGDERALQVLTPIFTAIGSMVYRIDRQQKTLYHVAGVLASNYMVTLAHHAQACLLAAGLDVSQTERVLASLLTRTSQNIAHMPEPQMALTGPLQRGDYATIAKHLGCIPESLQTLYRTLGIATLPLTTLDAHQQKVLKDLLSNDQ